MRYVDLPDGQRLAWEEHGVGDPVLLVMGTGADHHFWAAQVPALAARHRVITYDSRGTGASGDFARPEDCTPAALAADAAALLEAVTAGADISAGPAHVIGLSLGAAVAMELALARPDLVRSLGLHGSWARCDPWFLRMVEAMEATLRDGGLPGFIRGATAWILSPDFHAAHPDVVTALEAAYAGREPAPRVAGVLAHCHADRVHDALDRLPSLRLPTLVVTGERDIQVPPRYGRQVAAAVPGARFVELEGPRASHCACFEMAVEWNALTLGFLAEVGRA